MIVRFRDYWGRERTATFKTPYNKERRREYKKKKRADKAIKNQSQEI
jgi:hypothetical protein